MFKRLIYIYILVFIACSVSNPTYAAESKRYTSVVVVGHLFPLYKIYRKKGNYINKDNLNVLSKSIQGLSNVNRLILLGDTYFDDSNEVYEVVQEGLIDSLKVPFILINGNHETKNLTRFYKSGGVSRKIIDIDKFRLIFFSPWEKDGGKVTMKISNDDIQYFKSSLSDVSQNIVFVTDMVHHKNAGLARWEEDIVPLLKKYNVRYIVIGDNDRVQHRYSWVNLDGISYIHQGVAQNSLEPGINTYLELQLYKNGNVKFIPHAIPFDGLSDVYEMEIQEFTKIKSDCFICKLKKMLK